MSQLQVLEHSAACTFEELSHVQVGIAAVLEGSIPKFHLGNFCVTLMSEIVMRLILPKLKGYISIYIISEIRAQILRHLI